ncbi:hypothetical protein T07_12147 [Trichinella nelsoni]|uniref:Uncharacterized protein n=1 Tax=Trichinella nelsoni TaxID=6336 RepID=A0A0V0RKX3_9BILA|nr:hypothetical protein T07_12147 [Trichinella nelsoni]
MCDTSSFMGYAKASEIELIVSRAPIIAVAEENTGNRADSPWNYIWTSKNVSPCTSAKTELRPLSVPVIKADWRDLKGSADEKKRNAARNSEQLLHRHLTLKREETYSASVWSILSPWVRWDYLSGGQRLRCRMGVDEERNRI